MLVAVKAKYLCCDPSLKPFLKMGSNERGSQNDIWRNNKLSYNCQQIPPVIMVPAYKGENLRHDHLFQKKVIFDQVIK